MGHGFRMRFLRCGLYLSGTGGCLRAGIEEEYWPVRRDERDALKALKDLGCIVKKIKLPDLPYDSLETILFAEAAAAFEDLTQS